LQRLNNQGQGSTQGRRLLVDFLHTAQGFQEGLEFQLTAKAILAGELERLADKYF
jgi:hypothetical protein